MSEYNTLAQDYLVDQQDYSGSRDDHNGGLRQDSSNSISNALDIPHY